MYNIDKGEVPLFHASMFPFSHSQEQKLQEKQAHQKAQSQETVDGAVATSSVQGVKFVRGMAGTGQPFINYPQLDFEPQHLFCVGSPIGLFLSVRSGDHQVTDTGF